MYSLEIYRKRDVIRIFYEIEISVIRQSHGYVKSIELFEESEKLLIFGTTLNCDLT